MDLETPHRFWVGVSQIAYTWERERERERERENVNARVKKVFIKFILDKCLISLLTSQQLVQQAHLMSWAKMWAGPTLCSNPIIIIIIREVLRS